MRRFLNPKGFTLFEVLIAMAIAVVALIGASSAFLDLNKSSLLLQTKMDQEIDISFGLQDITRSLRQTAISYNALVVADDNGRNFFDLITDISANQIPNVPERSRQITLSLEKGKRTDSRMLFADDSVTAGLMYDPVDAYLVGPAPASFDITGSLQYAGVDHGKAISARVPEIWKDGSLILLYSPIPLRSSQNGRVDLLQPPAHPMFLGRVQGKDLVHDSLKGIVRSFHPARRNLSVNSADVFFRSLPSIAGAAPIVLAQPVSLMKFKFVAERVGGKIQSRVVTQVFSQGVWSQEKILFTELKALVFKRHLVSTPQISVTVVPAN